MEVNRVAPLVPESAFRRGGEGNSEAGDTVTASSDFRSFLTLLTAQLRNQDPLQPLDSTQFVAQLASFSTVEQLIGTNKRLDALSEQADASGMGSLGQWLGRDASAIDGRFGASGGPEAFRVPSIPGTSRTEAIVLRADGTEVDRFSPVPDPQGQATWLGAARLGIPEGTELRIELVYHGAAGVNERRPAAIFREVIGIRGTPDGPILDLADGGTLRPWEVAELRKPTG